MDLRAVGGPGPRHPGDPGRDAHTRPGRREGSASGRRRPRVGTTGRPGRVIRQGGRPGPEDGPRLSGELATAFDGVAEKMPLYESYEDLLSGPRRLESILPSDGEFLGEWNRTVLEPLSGQIRRSLRTEGLDLARSSAVSRPMTGGQKARLAEIFHSIARGFRAAEIREVATATSSTTR